MKTTSITQAKNQLSALLDLVCLDKRLSMAARREGFQVIEA